MTKRDTFVNTLPNRIVYCTVASGFFWGNFGYFNFCFIQNCILKIELCMYKKNVRLRLSIAALVGLSECVLLDAFVFLRLVSVRVFVWLCYVDWCLCLNSIYHKHKPHFQRCYDCSIQASQNQCNHQISDRIANYWQEITQTTFKWFNNSNRQVCVNLAVDVH